ncbi:MAG: glycosyltransferase family 4 protein [Myxococcota bacterium]|jgi:glycosyltransferase involved in cell wall biosynthesis|nr:glycosyltransferase family 4 protein [Myxococcota bacterium]
MPRIWASLDDFLPPCAAPEQVGRNMANHYFLRALLRHGTFDEYHFFLCNEAHAGLFWRAHGPMLDELAARSRVKVFPRVALLDQVRETDYTVFHLSDHVTSFNALCRVRNRLGAAFPVSGFIHSVSYGDFMSAYLGMLHGGGTAHDVILCSSTQGEQAVRRSIERLSTGLSLPPLKVGFEVVPLGIDDASATAGTSSRDERRAAARSALGLAQDAVVGLCFGRFSEVDKMDHMPLIQAFAALHRMEPPHLLVLAGAVQSENYVRMLELWSRAMGAQERVRFEKNVDEARKRLLYDAADYFVSVSDNPQETFGLTLLEALRAGLPLVVSDYDGYRDIGSDEVALRVPTIWHRPSGLTLIEPILDARTFHLYMAQCLSVDIPALTKALDVMGKDHERRHRMARDAALRFDECYSHKRTIQKLEAIWDERKAHFTAGPTDEDPQSLAVFDTFDHYPTRFLRGADRLRITGLGQTLKDTGASHPLLSGMSDLVDPSVVRDVLARLVDASTLDELEAQAAHKSWKTGYCIAWMLKHGLIELHES